MYREKRKNTIAGVRAIEGSLLPETVALKIAKLVTDDRIEINLMMYDGRNPHKHKIFEWLSLFLGYKKMFYTLLSVFAYTFQLSASESTG
jgi:hypothetical protein